ncbi:MAG: hypothetical protein JW828_06215 [Sedimentisphaerales bacterium]|nr:hypothetical protein [Sedimentisphaerales bacterium]
MSDKGRTFGWSDVVVVAAVAAAIVALLLPLRLNASDRQKDLLCRTNLRMYGVAMEHYLDDNDQCYPDCIRSVFDVPATIPLNCQWHDIRIGPWQNETTGGPLWPYIDNRQILCCPVFKKYALLFGDQHPGHVSNIPIDPVYDYSQNAFLGNTGGRVYGVLRKSEVVNPSRVFVFGEETIWMLPPTNVNRWVLNDTCFLPRHGNDSLFPGDNLATYHRTTLEKRNDGLANVVFVDGHVEACDTHDSCQTEWGGMITATFRLAWPKEGTYDEKPPYL